VKSAKEILIAPFDQEHREWVKNAPDDELDEYILLTVGNPSRHDLGKTERDKRHFKHLSKPHWTSTPVFIVGFLAMIFAGIAAWPVVRDWLPAAQPVHKDSSFQSPQSNSEAMKPVALETTPAPTNAAPSTNVLIQ
jgi:hypothetical protein